MGSQNLFFLTGSQVCDPLYTLRTSALGLLGSPVDPSPLPIGEGPLEYHSNPLAQEPPNPGLRAGTGLLPVGNRPHSRR